jgi:hypothetical protein
MNMTPHENPRPTVGRPYAHDASAEKLVIGQYKSRSVRASPHSGSDERVEDASEEASLADSPGTIHRLTKPDP